MGNMTWFGHAAFRFELEGKTLFVDPMLQNPNSPIKPQDINKADLVYVTHDHPDHLGDAIDICKYTGAIFAAVYELAEYASEKGVKNVARLNVGGTYSLDDVKLTVVQAVHSSTKGTPTGVIIRGENLTIYHAGDTALFGDMKLIGDSYCIDLACLPIGGTYTMDAAQATEAVEMLKPASVFPMHYATFPPLVKDIKEFKTLLNSQDPDVDVIELRPGEQMELTHKQMKALP